MPTYEYKCTQCGREIEAVQKFTDAALTTCDECGGELRKVFSSVGVVFKGSGFYKTDSRSGKSAVSTAASSSKDTGSSDSSSKDASPVTPAPAAATPTATPATSTSAAD